MERETRDKKIKLFAVTSSSGEKQKTFSDFYYQDPADCVNV